MRKEINLSEGMTAELNMLAKKRGMNLKSFIEQICEKVALEGHIAPKGLLEFKMTDEELLDRWKQPSRIVKVKKKLKPLTKSRIEAMVDANNKKLAELKSQGKTRCPLEMEKAFKENKKQH